MTRLQLIAMYLQCCCNPKGGKMTDRKELNTSRGDEIDSARLEEWTSDYIDEYYKDIPNTVLKNSDDRKDKK